MNCVIYARVSTEDQAELSIPAQLQAMHAFATRREWTVVGEFIEPGVSGRSVEARVALQALLRRCKEAPKIDYLLVHKVDRLARNIHDHVNIRFSLKQHDIRLASVVENVDDSISGQLLENIMASIAQFYSGNLGEEVKKGMRMKVAQGGWPHQPPRGYQLSYDAEGKRQIEPSEDAPIVRFAFEQYATNLMSFNRLRLILAERGLLTRSGKPFPHAGIERLLKNPFYVGRVRSGGAEFPGRHEAIVPEALFLRVQQIIASRPSDHGEKGRLKFFLRGIAYCGECRGKLTAERHGNATYYRCIRRILTPEHCDARMSNGGVTDAAVVSLYRRFRVAEDFRSEVLTRATRCLEQRADGRTAQRSSTRMKLVKAEQREVRLAEAFADGQLSEKAYRTAAHRVRMQILEAESGLSTGVVKPGVVLARVARFLKVANSLDQLHKSMDPDRQYRLVRSVFQRVYVTRGTIVGYELRTPLAEFFGDSRGDPSRIDLEDVQVTSAISTFFEVDTGHLDEFLQTA